MRDIGDFFCNAIDFDADWYGRTYLDVNLLGMSAREHFLRFGWRMNRPASPGATSGTIESYRVLLSQEKIVSYCIPMMNRPDDIKSTLETNLEENRSLEGQLEFIVAFYDSDLECRNWLKGRFSRDLKTGYLRVIEPGVFDTWHFGRAKNGFKYRLRGKVYSSLDADNFVTLDESQQIVDAYRQYGDQFVFHHFSGNWGDGTSGRVSLPTWLYEKVGYDERAFPRQFDEMDLIISTLSQCRGVKLLRYNTENYVFSSKPTNVFQQKNAFSPDEVIMPRVRRIEPKNPKPADYVNQNKMLLHMGHFNRLLCFAKNSCSRDLQHEYHVAARDAGHSLIENSPKEALLDLFFDRTESMPSVESGGISLFVCVKNDQFFLRELYDHYSKLGVSKFFIIDDGSAEPIRHTLHQENVFVFKPKVGTFVNSKILWVAALVKIFVRVGDWYLTVDADEFVDIPGEFPTLKALTMELDRRERNFCPGVLIDLLPNRDEIVRGEDCIGEWLCKFSKHVLVEGPVSKQYANHQSVRWGFGKYAALSWAFDARFHGFGTVDSLRKIPLVKNATSIRLNQGFHTLYCPETGSQLGNDIWSHEIILPLRHYKLIKAFFPDLRGRTETASLAYHPRTAENIIQLFSSDAGRALQTLSAVGTREYGTDSVCQKLKQLAMHGGALSWSIHSRECADVDLVVVGKSTFT